MKEEGNAAEARDEAIRTELKAIPDHEWAGIYTSGPGLSGVTLALAPNSGFTFRHWSDVAGIDLNHGRIKETLPDRLSFDCAIDPKLNDPQNFADPMIRITWGKRHYLVPERGMVEFCNAYNDGGLAFGRAALIMVRKGEEKAPAEGAPAVPDRFKKYILDKPIETIIRDVAPARHEVPEGLTMDTIRISATLPAGAKAGVQPGMVFHVVEPPCSIPATVMAVKDDECTVEFQQLIQLGEKAIDPQPGWKVSTRHWSTPVSPPKPDHK
jgi:hypothetical protein